MQEVLGRLVERLGVEHPHHVLWQLLALAHGHLDRSGRPSSRPGKGLHQRVDLAKVEAAKALLARVGAHTHRYGCWACQGCIWCRPPAGVRLQLKPELGQDTRCTQEAAKMPARREQGAYAYMSDKSAWPHVRPQILLMTPQ